jgi:hypothetical protein
MNQYGLMLLIVVILFAGRVLLPIAAPIANFLAGAPLVNY